MIFKLIQIPYNVPKLGNDEKTSFIKEYERGYLKQSASAVETLLQHLFQEFAPKLILYLTTKKQVLHAQPITLISVS